MVILFCSSDDDYAFGIIDWLKRFNCSYLKIDLLNYSFSNFTVLFKNNVCKIIFKLNEEQSFDFDDVSYFFFRSGKLLKREFSNKTIAVNYQIGSVYYDFDQNTLIDFVYEEIQKKALGWINQKPLNKLKQLLIAQKNGLKIPDTYILNSKKNLLTYTNSTEIVIKAVQENIFYQTVDEVYVQRVELVEIECLPNLFELSLLQEKIDKEIEIRCFYLNQKCYCIASLNFSKTIDIRESYDIQNFAKLQLGEEVVKKICDFMNEMGLISGSLDLILSKDNNLLFLEVNPEGQYEWVSVFGGYNLDKVIAEYLNNHEKKHIRKNSNRKERVITA